MDKQHAADARSRAAAAAAAAVASVAPGQREAVIQKTVIAMQQKQAQREGKQQQQRRQQQEEEGQEAAAKAAAPEAMGPPSSNGDAGAAKTAAAAPPGTYEPPEWAGVPEGVEYSLETLKGGTLLEERPLSAKDHYRFGRSPDADVVLEHPSASRLHAVLQFKGTTKEAFLFDCGSTHGTFLNKERLKGRVYAHLRVGDTFRFGQSSRMYVLGGPSALMPEEGLNRVQRRQLVLLEHAQRQKERDAEVARLQMESVLGRGEVTWGMAGDDAEQDAAAANDRAQVDWRRYSEKNPLNDKQQKLADQIRRRELKMSNLRTENERIQAKEGQDGGLTPGQASTLVRNEKAIDALAEEVDDLEEALNESIYFTITDKAKAKQGEAVKQAKRKRRPDSDDGYADASDSGDEFYDRTRVASTSGRGSSGGAAAHARKRQQGTKEPAVVESAETLYGKREVLKEEKQRLEAAIAEEELRLAEQAQGDAGHGDGPAASAAAEAGPQDDNVDSLDAFMTNVETQMEQNKITSLRAELASIQQQLDRAEKLLKIADPDGWYKPGKGAAQASKAKALQALQQDKVKRAAAAAEKKRAQEAAPFAPEVEEEEGVAAQAAAAAAAATASLHRLEGDSGMQGGLQVRKPPTAAPAAGASGTVAVEPGAAAAGLDAKASAAAAAVVDSVKERAKQKAKELVAQFAEPAPQPAKRPIKGPAMMPPKFHDATKQTSTSAAQQQQSADARVAAKLALLTGARSAAREGAGDGEGGTGADDGEGAAGGAAGWVPPSGQAGDGRTALNERFGY